MFVIVFLANPRPVVSVNEICVAPDTAEFLEVISWDPTYPGDLTGFKLVVDNDTIEFKPGVSFPVNVPVILDTCFLESSFSLDDDSGQICIIDTAGQGIMWFSYSPEGKGCYSNQRPPKPGTSLSLGYASPIEYMYIDSTPTPGQINDDMGSNRVYGTVVEKITGRPVHGAKVRLETGRFNCSAAFPWFYEQFTDSTGSYSIEFQPVESGSDLPLTVFYANSMLHGISLVHVENNYVDTQVDLEVIPRFVAASANGKMLAFPNPTAGTLTVMWQPDQKPLVVYDAAGRTVRILYSEPGKVDLTLKPGVYILQHGNDMARVLVTDR